MFFLIIIDFYNSLLIIMSILVCYRLSCMKSNLFYGIGGEERLSVMGINVFFYIFAFDF